MHALPSKYVYLLLNIYCSALSLFFIPLYQTLGQIGGVGDFEYINVGAYSKLTALGGINVSSLSDASAFTANPGLLVDSVAELVSLSYGGYYLGSSRTSLTFNKSFAKVGTWAFALQNLQHGNFDAFNAAGAAQGTFSANDLLITLANAHKVGNFSLGVNVKYAQSKIENFQASALFFDMGAAFIHPKKLLVIGLAIKNIGFPLLHYRPAQNFVMPFDIQAGVSFKPRKMPFAFSLTTHQLFRFNIGYDDPNDSRRDAFGNNIDERIGFFGQLSRHFVLASELIISKGFQLYMGYNFLTRNELRLTNASGLTGFSFGVMIKIKYFQLNYSAGIQHLSDTVSHFSLTFNTRNWQTKQKNKKKIVN